MRSAPRRPRPAFPFPAPVLPSGSSPAQQRRASDAAAPPTSGWRRVVYECQRHYNTLTHYVNRLASHRSAPHARRRAPDGAARVHQIPLPRGHRGRDGLAAVRHAHVPRAGPRHDQRAGGCRSRPTCARSERPAAQFHESGLTEVDRQWCVSRHCHRACARSPLGPTGARTPAQDHRERVRAATALHRRQVLSHRHLHHAAHSLRRAHACLCAGSARPCTRPMDVAEPPPDARCRLSLRPSVRRGAGGHVPHVAPRARSVWRSARLASLTPAQGRTPWWALRPSPPA
jgi:hypothetical protein